MIHLIELLSDVKTFPVKLAQKVGLEESVVFNFLVKTYANTKFYFKDTISSSYGIRDIKKVISNLIKYELIKEDAITGIYELNFVALEEIFYGQSEDRFSPELERAITRFIDSCKKKGKIHTRQHVLDMISGRIEEEVIKALNYSITNKFVTLFFNEGNKRHTSNYKTSTSSGGSTNKDRTVGKRSEEI